VKTKQDEYDPTNLLLLEATPSEGIVARSLKTRLEMTQSRSVILLQLCSPGEKRNLTSNDDDDSEMKSVQQQSRAVIRTRQHVDKELKNFRDRWTELSNEKGYRHFHSTVAIGGAISYGLNLQDYISGPISPSAYLVLLGLHQAAIAQNINERENRQVKVEDFLRDYRYDEKNSVRLRPGWRFLAPIPIRETSRS